MKFTENNSGPKRTSILIILGVFVIILTSLTISQSLRLIFYKTKVEVERQSKVQMELLKANLANYLKTNKNLLDYTFSVLPEVSPNQLESALDSYLLKVQHDDIRNIFFVDYNQLTLLYPHISRTPIPNSFVKQYDFLAKKIELAKKLKCGIYFTAPMLSLAGVPKNDLSLILVYPIFINDTYRGSLVESIDIASKLFSIFEYIKGLSVELSYYPIKNDGIYELSKFSIDKATFYIGIKKKSRLIDTLKQNIQYATLSLVFVIVVSITIIIGVSILLNRKIKREQLYIKTLQQLNKRIEMVKNIMAIKENFASISNIEKALKVMSNVFETDIAGIFLDKPDLEYVLKDGKAKQINFFKMEDSLSRIVWNRKESVIVNDYQSYSFVSDKAKLLSGVKSAMCALISYKDHSYGVICVGNTKRPNAFRKEDLNFLKLIASIFAINMYFSNLDKDAIEALLNAIEARDRYTEGHSRRVWEYARFISEILGFDETYQNNIYKAGLFHDVGKIGIPDVILLKPTRLSPNEYEIMKMHSVFSYEILKHVEMLSSVIGGIRGHHERWDGKGYPDGLRGEDIPIEARILAIADSFDAIITSRPYKSAMNVEDAKAELIANAGTQFDPNIIKKIEPYVEDMYRLGKDIEKQKRHLFPENIEEIRKNIFFTDWLTGLSTMDKLEREIGGLIIDNAAFSLCLIDVVNFSKIRFEKGKAQAVDLIVGVANILKDNIGECIARVNEDNFIFILKDNINPKDRLDELRNTITSKLGCSIICTYVVYPKDGRTTDELIYNIRVKEKEVRRSLLL